MATVPCPGCRAPLELAQELCPACRRPRGPDEIDDARRALYEAGERRKALPRRLALWALVAAAAAGLFSQRRIIGERLARVRPPAPAPAPAASPVEEALGAARAEAAGAALPVAAEPVREKAADGPARSASPPPPPAPNLRRLYGLVYDLETLGPVLRARVLIKNPVTNSSWVVYTDRDGHYMSEHYLDDFAAGLIVSVTAEGYRDGHLEESGSPYRERSLESRRLTLEETTDSDLGPTRVPRGDGAPSVELDFAVLPAKRP